jgi:hypothetical protein
VEEELDEGRWVTVILLRVLNTCPRRRPPKDAEWKELVSPSAPEAI